MKRLMKDLGLTRLSVPERIQLAQELWDSVAKECDGLPLSTDQREEMQRRIAEVDGSEMATASWEEVRQRLPRRE